jgi:hypothetical protein
MVFNAKLDSSCVCFSDEWLWITNSIELARLASPLLIARLARQDNNIRIAHHRTKYNWWSSHTALAYHRIIVIILHNKLNFLWCCLLVRCCIAVSFHYYANTASMMATLFSSWFADTIFRFLWEDELNGWLHSLISN